MNVAKGEKWNRWRVLRATTNASEYAWCRCACGTKKYVRVSNLIYGTSRSCGCLIGDTHRTHGQSQNGSSEYTAWEHMLGRCYNTNHRSFRLYGGRGIRVAKAWRGRGGFARFLAHVGPRPSTGHSLDRHPNRDGNYEPGNVRWATRKEQNQNTNRNVLLTFRGETHCISEWARIVGIGKKTLADRVKRGWSAKDALTTKPVRTRDYT